MRFGRSNSNKSPTKPASVADVDPQTAAEERLLGGILSQAEIDDVAKIEGLLRRAQIKASELVSGPEARNEAQLQQAGISVGDCHKIMRVLRTFHSETAASASRPPQPAATSRFAGSVLGVHKFAPSMKCGLIVYSTTVLIITLCVLSFYLPAVLYQVRNQSRRIAHSVLQPAQGQYTPAPPGTRTRSLPGGAMVPQLQGRDVMVVTANQPLPCTTRRGDWVMGLALRNKLMYATLHGYKMWWSTELVSSWDLEAAWNKIPLLYILMHPESQLSQGIEWMLWMDDDAIFTDMEFNFPFADYDAAGINLVIWGDPQRVYRANDIQGLNTGVFLLRKCEWSRQLMAEVAALATPSIRRQIGNKGRIAEQGALTWVLHSQSAKWKDRTLLERNFTMNGNWMDYAGKWQKGQRKLTQAVWGQDTIPFVVQYAGCQMCRGHSENGSWHDQGVRKCQSAFLEAYTFGDDQALAPLGLRHLTMDTHLVRSNPGSELFQRHLKMTRCLPKFLVIGTQKGGTSSFHFLLKSGWHDDIQMNNGEKEIHYFSWDENFRKGPLVYQQRFDGSGDRLGVCSNTESKVLGEVSATYLDYPKAAERAAQLLPSAKIVVLLREPTSRLVSSFNMKWQVEICGKLTWTRNDCYNGITSPRIINENNVAVKQRQAAMAVWNRCNVDKKSLDHTCLANDFKKKLTDKVNAEVEKLQQCAQSGWEDLQACLGVQGLDQTRLYAMMEDGLFVYRSMYVEHISRWLRVYSPESMLVLASEHMKDAKDMKQVMMRFSKFMEIPADGEKVHHDLIFKASPASKDGSVHENGRSYIGEAPADLGDKLNKIFCPKNQELAQLLLDKKLAPSVDAIPWLATALKRDLC